MLSNSVYSASENSLRVSCLIQCCYGAIYYILKQLEQIDLFEQSRFTHSNALRAFGVFYYLYLALCLTYPLNAWNVSF
jgi:hypothetical protein